MCVRITLSLLFALVVSPLAAADPANLAASEVPAFPTFPSAEAIRDRIDQAMPGILKRDQDIIQKLLEGLAQADKVEPLMKSLRDAWKTDDALTPVDWTYFGEKSVGSVYRQLAYVCRYESHLVAWRFLLIAREGRWSLFSINVGATFEDLLEVKTVGDERCAQLCDKLADRIVQGDMTAVDLFKERWAKHDTASEPFEIGQVRKLVAAAIILGKPLKCERISSRETAQLCAQYQYLLQWKGGTSIINIWCYYISGQWRLLYVTTSGNDANELLAHAAWDPRTRQAAKPQDTRLK